MPFPKTDEWERLLRHRVIDANGCWIADVGSDNKGYRYIGRAGSGRKIYAHRLAYERLVGPLTHGLTIDHLCRNRSCFNPQHLEQITSGENVLRGNTTSGINSRKTHCKKGHPFAGDNLQITTAGRRRCRACEKREPKPKPTHCKHGHERTPETFRAFADGKKRCIPCAYAKNSRTYYRHREARLAKQRAYDVKRKAARQ